MSSMNDLATTILLGGVAWLIVALFAIVVYRGYRGHLQTEADRRDCRRLFFYPKDGDVE